MPDINLDSLADNLQDSNVNMLNSTVIAADPETHSSTDQPKGMCVGLFCDKLSF